MGAKQSDWVQRGRGVVQRLREKWGTARERAAREREKWGTARERAARERAGELIARDRAEARAEAVRVVRIRPTKP